jgi:hypothetical protein
MKHISYRIRYTGVRFIDSLQYRTDGEEEIVRVSARSINSGFPKALRKAQEPLGSGERREILSVEFWEVH